MASVENWRDVVGYEGRYQVSDLGRVRSLLWGEPRVLKAVERDYLAVSLYKDRVLRPTKIHLMVLEAFVGPRPQDLQGCHNDGNTRNNRLSNLRWDTAAANAQDRLDHGRHAGPKRTTCPQGHALRMPNLYRRAWEAKRHRSCLACMRGRTTAKNVLRDQGRRIDFRIEADAHYRKIMGRDSAVESQESA